MTEAPNTTGGQPQVGSDDLLAAAAVRWWEARRSQGFSVESHLRNPTLNCNDSIDDALALAVAEYVAANAKDHATDGVRDDKKQSTSK